MNWTVPSVAECDPNIEPFEFQVLLAMAEFSRTTPSGLTIPESVADREEWGATHARLLAVSPMAFNYVQLPPGARAPQVGDIVFCGRFPGDEVPAADKHLPGRAGRKYRLCSDREIRAVIERAEQPIPTSQPNAATVIKASREGPRIMSVPAISEAHGTVLQGVESLGH